MTIAATPRRSPVYTGNGVATTYAFAFKVLDATTLVVTVADENDLNSAVLVNGVDYTVTLNADQDASPGGEIAYAGLPVGHRLVITSATDASQPTAIANLGQFHANVIEAALDRIVIQHQQQQEQLDRCVKVVATSEQDPSLLLDTAVTSASNSAAAAASSAGAASGFASAASASAAAAAASAATIDTATLVKRDGSQAMSGPLATPMVVTDSPLSFRNKIINGGFDIWQRGTSQTANGFGSDDRWSNGHVGSSKTHSLKAFAVGQTDVPGNPRYYSRTAVASVAGAGNYVVKFQKIEGASTLSGKTVTLSFYAKAHAANYIAVEFQQEFGTGGAPSAAVTGIGSQKVALTTAWQRFEVTVAIPSIAGKTLGTNNDDSLGVFFWFDAGSDYNARTATLGQQSGTFDIANVQVEEGSVATPFEQRPVGLELSLCQRYYERAESLSTGMVSYAAGAFTISAPIRFCTRKRASPYFTVDVSSMATTAGATCSSGTVTSPVHFSPIADAQQARLIITHSGTAPAGAVLLGSVSWTADAEL